jgi:class 3 adenylate cyclase
VNCASCGAQNAPGQKFCGACGAPLAVVCSSCGNHNQPGQRFCGECGAQLGDPPAAAAPVEREAPAAERRFVSVLFADLVGFTSLSETRDSEEVRELLSAYFERCKQLIERYGGTVEKFIGDAVWRCGGPRPRTRTGGQYAFLQDIVRHVAYETIGRRERKAKHLGAAEHLASVWSAEEDEIVEVVAAHYLDAYRAAPEDPDAGAIRDRARELLVRAGERAASLGANAEAQRAFERAVELTDDPLVQAELHEGAGVMANLGARPDQAAEHLERSIALFESAGATHPAARVSAKLAEIVWDRGRIEEGLESMNRAFEVLSGEEPDEDVAALAAQLGRFTYFAGDADRGLQRVETALDIAEALSLPEVLSQALNTKAIMLNSGGRKKEGAALLAYALETALEHDKPSAALRAYYNLAELRSQSDRYEEAAETAAAGLTLARRVGSRYWEWSLLGAVYPFFALGRWDEVVGMIGELPEEQWSELRNPFLGVLGVGVQVNVHRGLTAEAERVTTLLAELETSADVQERGCYHWGASRLALAQRDPALALRLAETAWATWELNGFSHEAVKEPFVVAVEAALALDDLAKAEELLTVVESLPLGRQPQFLRAQASRFRGRLATLKQDADEAERGFKGAAGLFREIAVPFYLAVVELERGEWLAGQGRSEEAELLLVEAREIFEWLEATPWLERVGSRVGAEVSA